MAGVPQTSLLAGFPIELFAPASKPAETSTHTLPIDFPGLLQMLDTPLDGAEVSQTTTRLTDHTPRSASISSFKGRCCAHQFSSLIVNRTTVFDPPDLPSLAVAVAVVSPRRPVADPSISVPEDKAEVREADALRPLHQPDAGPPDIASLGAVVAGLDVPPDITQLGPAAAASSGTPIPASAPSGSERPEPEGELAFRACLTPLIAPSTGQDANPPVDSDPMSGSDTPPPRSSVLTPEVQLWAEPTLADVPALPSPGARLPDGPMPALQRTWTLEAERPSPPEPGTLAGQTPATAPRLTLSADAIASDARRATPAQSPMPPIPSKGAAPGMPVRAGSQAVESNTGGPDNPSRGPAEPTLNESRALAPELPPAPIQRSAGLSPDSLPSRLSASTRIPGAHLPLPSAPERMEEPARPAAEDLPADDQRTTSPKSNHMSTPPDKPERAPASTPLAEPPVATIPIAPGRQVSISTGLAKPLDFAAEPRQSSGTVRPPQDLPPSPGSGPIPDVPPRPTLSSRAIEFQLESGAGRVAVRVADRAGSVTVDVRTPDSRLASTLRGDLPELASRIEQTGYRAEIWHPAAASQPLQSPERLRLAASPVPSQDSQNQSPRDQGQPRDDGQNDSGESSHPEFRKQDRKDFQWLFTSIR